MRSLKFPVAAVGVVTLVASGPVAAGGLTEAGELQHARLNALAGGPVSERDAELLERWGCLSGTPSAFCQRQTYRWQRDRAHGRHRRQ